MYTNTTFMRIVGEERGEERGKVMWNPISSKMAADCACVANHYRREFYKYNYFEI